MMADTLTICISEGSGWVGSVEFRRGGQPFDVSGRLYSLDLHGPATVAGTCVVAGNVVEVTLPAISVPGRYYGYLVERVSLGATPIDVLPVRLIVSEDA